MRRPARALLALSLMTLMTACAQCAPEEVGTGVARLTVRNLGAVSSMVASDLACGFQSSEVIAGATLDGAVGGPGTVTFTVDECEIDAAAFTFVPDCNGDTKTGSGRVTVSATQTIAGVLTGDPQNPVVPGGPDALTITIERADFDTFRIDADGSKNALTIVSGALSGIVKPRLAVSVDTGACAVPTPDAAFSEVSYAAGARVVLHTGTDNIDVEVEGSAFEAQSGVGQGGAENSIAGTISVFGGDPTPIGADGAGLDPEYDAALFNAAYVCDPDLASPLSFECADLTPALADGAARLSAATFGTLVGIIDADAGCGFASEAVLSAGTTAGTVGRDGSLTLTVSDCSVDLPADTVVATDCNGAETRASGTVVVTATKIISGRFTGNPAAPIVPDSDTPAVFDLDASLTDFSLSSSANRNALLVRSGQMSGQLAPRTALSGDTAACSIASPHATITALTLGAADLAVSSAAGTFDLAIEGAAIDAVNGAVGGGAQNTLSGTVTIDGEDLSVPSDGLGLDPNFDLNAFDARWTCDDELVNPVSYNCGFVAPTGQGAAQLSVRTLGVVASLVDADATCGFSSAAVAGAPVFDGQVGDDLNTAVFNLGAGCTLDFPAAVVVATDCNGVTTTVRGSATVTGTKSVIGYNTGNPAQPVLPTRADAVSFSLSVEFSDFVVDNSASTSALTIASGTLTGDIAPLAGLDATTRVCSIATPDARFINLIWSDAEFSLETDGSLFDLSVASSAFSAATASNTMTGSLIVDTIPVAASPVLDPAFDAQVFADSFACLPNLDLSTNPPVCDLRGVLGPAAARLLVKHAATAMAVADADTGCGFSNATVITDVGGGTADAGEPDTLTFRVDPACSVNLGPAAQFGAPDCLATETHVGGGISFDGNKTLKGTSDGAGAVVPDLGRDGLSFEAAVTFNDFETFDLPGATRSTLSGAAGDYTLTIIAGERDGGGGTSTGEFSIKTPVFQLTNFTLPSATMVLVQDGNTFNLALSEVTLNAFNGTFGANGNVIDGTLTLDGQTFEFLNDPPDDPPQPLDPAFDQATFDAAYVCTPDLLEVVP